jgi:hypothetical protein
MQIIPGGGGEQALRIFAGRSRLVKLSVQNRQTVGIVPRIVLLLQGMHKRGVEPEVSSVDGMEDRSTKNLPLTGFVKSV